MSRVVAYPKLSLDRCQRQNVAYTLVYTARNFLSLARSLFGPGRHWNKWLDCYSATSKRKRNETGSEGKHPAGISLGSSFSFVLEAEDVTAETTSNGFYRPASPDYPARLKRIGFRRDKFVTRSSSSSCFCISWHRCADQLEATKLLTINVIKAIFFLPKKRARHFQIFPDCRLPLAATMSTMLRIKPGEAEQIELASRYEKNKSRKTTRSADWHALRGHSIKGRASRQRRRFGNKKKSTEFLDGSSLPSHWPLGPFYVAGAAIW